MKQRRAGSVLFVLAVACGGEAPPARTVSTRFAATSSAPADARVFVDDRFIGTLEQVQKQGVALPVGKHTVSVEREGYFPWDQVVVAAEGAPLRLDVALRTLPD